MFSDSTHTPPERLEAEVEGSLCGRLFFFFLLDFCRGTAGFSVLPQCSSGPGVWLCVWPPPAPLQTDAQQVLFFFFLNKKRTVFLLSLKVSSMRLCKFWRRGKFTGKIPYLLAIGHEYKLW